MLFAYIFDSKVIHDEGEGAWSGVMNKETVGASCLFESVCVEEGDQFIIGYASRLG